MSRRVLPVVAVLVVVVAAYVWVTSAFSGSKSAATTKATPAPQMPARTQAHPAPANADVAILKLELPAKDEPLAWEGAGHGEACPQTQVSSVLGIEIGNPHGIVVAKVIKNGPAEKAGIAVGDSIVQCDGQAVTCPSSLAPLLARGAQRRTIELGVIDAPQAAPQPH